MDKDVIIVAVNGHPLALSIFNCTSLTDVGRLAAAGSGYAPRDVDDWQFFAPDGTELPRSMSVRELAVADDSRPDLIFAPRPGVAA